MSTVTGQEYLLEIDHATRFFHVGGLLNGTKLMAVNNVSLALSKDKPEIFTIAGESGSGKTTLSRLLLRDLEPSEGDVRFEGRSVTKIKKREEFKAFMKKVQPVFQNPFDTFNPLRRVEEYLYDTAINFDAATDRKSATAVVDKALHSVGLSL
ncbi:MAG: ATP-binding cassette domain-containing protein, partial [Treponema sp.]|nr:ATP-binding cassette domain-containing protein [Treponema sp.]